jgi:glucokinase
VGIDVGGTHLRAALVRFSGATAEILAEAREPTGIGASGAIDRIVGLVDAMLAAASARDLTVDGIGIGVAGHLGLDGVLRQSAHTPALVGVDLGAALRGRAPRISVENDANCTGLAAVYTSESPFESDSVPAMMLLVTMGTGIGGAALVDGRLLRGSSGMAGEFGHMIVDPEGLLCACGQRGCWETIGAGSSLARLARAEMNDPEGRLSGAEVEAWLAEGLGSLVQIFDPELVVVGGGVTAHGRRLLDALNAALERTISGFAARHVRLQLAPGGPRAGVIGAALASVP